MMHADQSLHMAAWPQQLPSSGTVHHWGRPDFAMPFAVAGFQEATPSAQQAFCWAGYPVLQFPAVPPTMLPAGTPFFGVASCPFVVPMFPAIQTTPTTREEECVGARAAGLSAGRRRALVGKHNTHMPALRALGLPQGHQRKLAKKRPNMRPLRTHGAAPQRLKEQQKRRGAPVQKTAPSWVIFNRRKKKRAASQRYRESQKRKAEQRKLRSPECANADTRCAEHQEVAAVESRGPEDAVALTEEEARRAGGDGCSPGDSLQGQLSGEGREMRLRSTGGGRDGGGGDASGGTIGEEHSEVPGEAGVETDLQDRAQDGRDDGRLRKGASPPARTRASIPIQLERSPLPPQCCHWLGARAAA